MARPFSTVMAPDGQVRMHLPQPMHPMLHTAMVPLALSQLEHRTTACFFRGTKEIIPLGQAATHWEQPLHLAGSMRARPLHTVMCPYWQPRWHAPRPLQPNRQLVPPPMRKAAAEQLWMPSYSILSVVLS